MIAFTIKSSLYLIDQYLSHLNPYVNTIVLSEVQSYKGDGRQQKDIKYRNKVKKHKFNMQLGLFLEYHFTQINTIYKFPCIKINDEISIFKNSNYLNKLSYKTLQLIHQMQPRNIEKYIENSNKEVLKSQQNFHNAILHMECILGIDNLDTSSVLSLNDQQILYYSCKYFIIYNLSSKQYQIINKDMKQCKLMQIKKFDTNQSQKKLIVCLYQGQKAILNQSMKKKDDKNDKIVEKQEGQTSNENIENKQKATVPKENFSGKDCSSNTYIGLLTLNTDYQSRTSRNDDRYEWKTIKLSTQPIIVEDLNYIAKKNFLYFVITKHLEMSHIQTRHQQKIGQFLWIYDLKKQLMILTHEVKSNTIGYYVKKLIIQEFNLIYLMGRNYFRQWTINFNDRSMKQSNVRNVERMLKGKQIVDVKQIQKYSTSIDNISHHMNVTQSGFKGAIPLNSQDHLSGQSVAKNCINPHLLQNNNSKQILYTPSKLILILTKKQLLLVKKNELVSLVIPERNMSKQPKNKDNIQNQLENSLNQIYKMKFLFDQYEQRKQKQDSKNQNTNKNDQILPIQDISFNYISTCWQTQDKNHYFAISTNKHNVLIYQLCDFQVKLDTEYNYTKEMISDQESQFKSIIPTQGGDVLLIVSDNKQVRIINQEVFNEAEDDMAFRSLWGNGQMHQGEIYSLCSPVVQNIMCSAGSDGTFKLWSLKKNQKTILFEEKSKQKPKGITIHPSGMIIGVNFQKQIKLFSILPKQFYEITSIKTNYSSLQLKYSERGQFLVSNQGHILIFYEPFSLKTLGYIEPADLKCNIIDFQISQNAEYICFITQDNAVFIEQIEIGQLSKWELFYSAHHQIQPYTCFIFDVWNSFGSQNLENNIRCTDKNVSLKSKNIFVGATKNKYMTIYSDFGKKVLAEFPIIDCSIVDMQIHQKLLFVATSKGTVRVYNWPILQENLQFELICLGDKKIRYKAPSFLEYQIWSQKIPIKKIHKLRFTNQLIVANEFGNMAIMNFQQTKGNKPIYEDVSVQHKKMQQLINEMFYIKKSETDKRNKLIQKTQNDILKVENQIQRQKIILSRKMNQEQGSVEKNFLIKNNMQQQDLKEYIDNSKKQIAQLKAQIQVKQQSLSVLKKAVTQSHQDKKMYQKNRNQGIIQQIKSMIGQHKQRIKHKIEIHKNDVKMKKKEYWVKVKDIQVSFEKQIQMQMKKIIKDSTPQASKESQNSTNRTLSKNPNRSSKKLKRISVSNIMDDNKQNRVKDMSEQLNDQIISELTSKESQQILIQGFRVQQLQMNNSQLEKQINILQKKVENMECDDQNLQKEFQRNLEDYNLSRFQNLNLHSEVLKMQNQVIQRKQVLENKQGIVMLAYQQKQKLQNYKQLVKGSLNKLQEKKQSTRDIFFRKENDLNSIFSELVNEIHKMENKRDDLQKMERNIQISEKQHGQRQSQIKDVIDKLKDIKKFLLLERMNEDKAQQNKSTYQYQEQLLTAITFLKKRLYMESIKQKKSKQLKKSSLNQILKQNKNLLQECNQLRSQGIQYENEIKNLSNKLKQANKMINIQSKLKNQKSDVNHQKGQLQIIRELFKIHLNQFEDQDNEENNQNKNNEKEQNIKKVESVFENQVSNVQQVHYDAQQDNSKVSEENSHKQFTLSMPISAPFQVTDI